MAEAAIYEASMRACQRGDEGALGFAEGVFGTIDWIVSMPSITVTAWLATSGPIAVAAAALTGLGF